MMDYEFSDRLFGDKIEITLYDIEPQLAKPIAEDAYREALRLQKIFNIYDDESELSLLNRTRKKACSEELLKVLKRALEYCKRTRGLYDISLGKLFLQRKGQGKGEKPRCTYKDIKIEGNEVLLEHEDVLIDLGSIAKGYIVDKVVDFLEDNGIGSGMVDGRGDIRVFGDVENHIDIQHPRKDETIATIRAKDEAIATSGDYNQYIGSYDKSHLVNNRYFSSVTVIANTLEEADVLATVISLLDEKTAGRMIGKDIKAITIDKHMKTMFHNTGEA